MITGLHVEPTNLCTLKCLGCARTRFLQQWPQHWRNHNVDADDLSRFLDVDLKDVEITLCGNYGDPIYHPRLPYLIQTLKLKGCVITIITNGSHRKAEWWQELCASMTHEDKILFSIDGLPENFMLYRENADWHSIQNGIEVCRDNGIKTIWKFIPFRYNQNEIELARELSQQLGMTAFLIDPSDRFDSQTQHLMPTQNWLGGRWSAQQELKHSTKNNMLDPKCARGDQHFVSAEGFYVPCCFIADHRFYHKTFWSKQKNQFDIAQTRLSEILGRPQTIQFYHDLANDPSTVCQYNCPKSG